jgi:hypothetical protein
MINIIRLANGSRQVSLLSVVLFISTQVFAQNTSDWKLEKMPVELETDFALSSLPPHLRSEATVYLLDPEKGFYVSKKGSNGFICFVSRTEWEWAEFRQDLATPISYDAEGARTIFPLYMDVAAMRASGKFTPAQIKDSMIARIKRGVYKAPERTGISYMLAPVMRVYPARPDEHEIVTMSFPHYMFYAPYITNADIGAKPHSQFGPILNNPSEWVLGERKGPYGYVIMPAAEAEKMKIVEDGKQLLERLVAYKPYFKVETGSGHH